jgi:hypothetical protein
MSDKPDEFRQRLFNAQEMTPSLRDAYENELDALLRPKPTPRTQLPGILLLAVLLPAIAIIVRNIFVHRPGPMILIAWGILAAAFSSAAFLILRDLWQKKHSRKSAYSIASILTVAAGGVTVVSLMMGLKAPSDPKSMFSAFYVFVFYFACVVWSLENRIAAAELSAKEQSLRIECRLADLAEKMGAGK